MPQIHTTGTTYTPPSPIQGWRWQPYGTNSGHLKTLREAFQIVGRNIRNHQPCNQAFNSLPGGRSFSQVWSDNAIWVSYDPGNARGRFGATLGNHITIAAYALNMGRWTAAATLVHELAHVNGAPGTDTQAEDTLLKCLLRGLHDPNIIGDIRRGSAGANRLA